MANIKIPIALLLMWVGISGITSPFWIIPKLPGVIGLITGIIAFVLLGILIWGQYKIEKELKLSKRKENK